MTLAPVFFISHGAPTFALEPGRLGATLGAIGRRLPPIRAALVVSPHWQTRQVEVMGTARPETVHDFGGFPRALYSLDYPAPGDPDAAAETARVLAQAGFPVGIDAQRGLDHGAWVPLRHLLPEATTPVFQVSMPYELTPASALALGRALAPLRAAGIMIVASGGLTHNLYEFRLGGGEAPYVREFSAWVRQTVLADDAEKLARYRTLAPHAERAHPSEEHFLPLLVAQGARAPDESPQVIEGDITYGVLAMESYVWGLPPLASLVSDHTESAA